MSRPWLRVHIDDRNDWSAISGPGAGRLIQRAGGKLWWSRERRAWMSNRRIADNVLAIADYEHRKVSYTEDEHLDQDLVDRVDLGDQDLVDRGDLRGHPGGEHSDLGGVA